MSKTFACMFPMVLAAAAACADTPLTVMSFNILYKDARAGTPQGWANRKPIVVNAIKQANPDVFGVQECLIEQAEFLADALPRFHWIGVGREADGGGEMSAIFYRQDLLSPLETGHFWLSETPETPGSKSWETACTRMVTWARFRHCRTDCRFCYYNTHFDHRSAQARLRAAELVVTRTGRIPVTVPLIMTGDFNARAERDDPWRVLTGAGFRDAWLDAAERIGPELTFGGFRTPKQDDKGRIDWVLVRGPIDVQSCQTSLYNEDGLYPSDHFPVVARLTIKKD